MTDETPERNRSPVRGGELISSLSALLLLTLMFAVEWFGVAGVPGASKTRAATTTAIDAWHAMTVLRWLMLLTIVVTLSSMVLHLTQRRHGRSTATGLTIAVLGSLTAALVAWRVLVALPKPDQIIDQKLGAIVGLVAALGIAFGGYERMREERRVARRVDQQSTEQSSEMAGRLRAR